MAGKSRMSSWSVFRIVALPCMFLCSIFKKPIFQWIALAALAVWVAVEIGRIALPRIMKRIRARQSRVIAPRETVRPVQEEPADNSLLLQINYRITEQLKLTYPNVSWLWENRPGTAELKRGGTWRIVLSNTDPFNYGEVHLNASGAMNISLLQVIPLREADRIPEKDDSDLHESEILNRFDVKAWYAKDGEKALCEIVEELNTQGYKKLRITEGGEVIIAANDGDHPFETIRDFPPKAVWSDLCVLVREDDIQASVDGTQLAIAW